MTTHSPEPTTPDDVQDDDAGPAARPDRGDAPPIPAGDDVRIGPDQSDRPQAGAAEPTD